jgi:hypothetical protein
MRENLGDLMRPPRKSRSALIEARINQEAIGAGLRRMFDEVVNEPVPDDFLEILQRAEVDGSVDGDPEDGR